MYWQNHCEFSELIGKTLVKCYSTDDEVYFETGVGEGFVLYHDQDCCENVYVESIDGDLEDLVGTPILQAEEVSNDEGHDEKPLSEYEDSYTWTFYKLATIKGYVTIRFYGSSNGYYSESVNCRRL